MTTIGVSSVIIEDHQGRILLLKRSRLSSTYPGYWNLPGGYVEEGETTAEGGSRELLEETGLIAEPDELDLLGTYVSFAVDPPVAVHLYHAESYRGAVSTDWESSSHRWVDPLALDHYRLLPGLGEALSRILIP